MPAIRWPRHCWRMACNWWAAASSCTGRAASCPAGSRSLPAWWIWARARGALPTCVRRWSNSTTGSSPAASIAGRAWVSIWAPSTTDLAALLPAGFYYKTFKWPSWHLFEPSIRRMAGLGKASGLSRSGPLRGSGGSGRRTGHRRRHCRVECRGGGGRGGRGHPAVGERPPRSAAPWPGAPIRRLPNSSSAPDAAACGS